MTHDNHISGVNLNLSFELCNMISQNSKLSTLNECPTVTKVCKSGPTKTHAIVLKMKEIIFKISTIYIYIYIYLYIYIYTCIYLYNNYNHEPNEF